MRDTERTAEQKLKDRYKYQNEYIKSKYDRLALALPKGYKAIIDSRTKEKGFRNTTDYIKALIDQDASGGPAAAPEAKKPEPIKPEPFRDPNEGISWEGDPLPFG